MQNPDLGQFKSASLCVENACLSELGRLHAGDSVDVSIAEPRDILLHGKTGENGAGDVHHAKCAQGVESSTGIWTPNGMRVSVKVERI